MANLGMTYQYSHHEQWQLKNILVVFRIYQLNLDRDKERVYRKYWDISYARFVEQEL